MGHFVTTSWSLVAAAHTTQTPEGREAMATLCDRYWYPLYAYLRRRGHTADEAQDLTQGFFLFLLEHHTLERVDQRRGRFRSFLLASLNHYVSNAHDWERAQKRGGGTPRCSLDTDVAEARYRHDLVDRCTPEAIFDRDWALAVLEQVLTWVEFDYQKAGNDDLFQRLKGCLTGQPVDASYREIGVTLGMSEAAVKQAVHRLRGSYRHRLYDVLATTVSTPDQIEPELQHLIGALTR